MKLLNKKENVNHKSLNVILVGKVTTVAIGQSILRMKMVLRKMIVTA